MIQRFCDIFKDFFCGLKCQISELARTKHGDLGRLTVSLADHVGTHTDVHASVALPRVGDHQLPSTDLKENNGTLQSLQHLMRSVTTKLSL